MVNLTLPITCLDKSDQLNNDKCFADHMTVADALNINTYFTRPYTSEDQGTVENRID